MAAVSLDALTGAVTGWPLLALVLSYAVFPYAVLWLAVRLWPKGHPRRAELLAEYAVVDWWMRPLWVGDNATRCLLDGLAARAQRVRPARRAEHGRRRGGPRLEWMGLIVSSVAAVAALIGQWTSSGVAATWFVGASLFAIVVASWSRWAFNRRRSVERRGRDRS